MEQQTRQFPTPAANPVAPVVTLSLPKLSKDPIALSFEHADFAEAEFRLGIPLLGVPAAEFWAKSAPAYQTKVLLYVGLLHRFPALEFKDLREHVTFANAADVEAAVAEAFAKALPEILGPGKEADTPGESDVPFEAASSGGSTDGPPADSISVSPMTNSGG